MKTRILLTLLLGFLALCSVSVAPAQANMLDRFATSSIHPVQFMIEKIQALGSWASRHFGIEEDDQPPPPPASPGPPPQRPPPPKEKKEVSWTDVKDIYR